MTNEKQFFFQLNSYVKKKNKKIKQLNFPSQINLLN